MDDKLRQALCDAFAAPSPARKDDFLNQITDGAGKESKLHEMVFTQIRYIHKGAWVYALVVFAAVLYFLSNLGLQAVFLAAALTPFLSLAVLVESNRSIYHHMAELEAAAKNSLKSVVFCKLLILGSFDLIVLVVITVLIRRSTGYSLLLTGAYIALPYLLTMWLGLIVERTRIGREKPYVAVGVSVMVSVLMLILAGNPTRWMKQQYGQWWGVMSVVLLVGIILMVKDKMEQVRAFYGTEC